jgi:uncharacterized protein
VTAGAYRLVVGEATPEGRAAFARMAVPYLARRETLNNLQLAILDHVGAGRYEGAILLAAEDERGDLAAVLMRTPPHPLLIAAGCDPRARELLLERLLRLDPDPPGLVGPLPDAAAAAAWWQEHTGQRMRRAMHQGIYRLRAVREARRAVGSARLVGPDDRALVTRWLVEFAAEALGRDDLEPDSLWESYQGDGVRRLYLWEDARSQPVSLAGRSGRTPNGVRLGPVYTPLQLRGHGYAEALVAAVCARELAEGARLVFLYTDLDNAVSNSLYLRVGFAFVGDSAEYRIEHD